MLAYVQPVPSPADTNVPSVHTNALALVGAGKEHLLLKVRVHVGTDVGIVELWGQAGCCLPQLLIYLLNKC